MASAEVHANDMCVFLQEGTDERILRERREGFASISKQGGMERRYVIREGDCTTTHPENNYFSFSLEPTIDVRTRRERGARHPRKNDFLFLFV